MPSALTQVWGYRTTFNPHLKRRPFWMSPISIHLHRRYQSGARISMLTLPLKEVNMVTQTNEQFWIILSIVLPSGGCWETNGSVNTHNFVKIHLKGKRVERLAGLGSHVIQSLDLKSLKLLICDKKLKSKSWKITGLTQKAKPSSKLCIAFLN